MCVCLFGGAGMVALGMLAVGLLSKHPRESVQVLAHSAAEFVRESALDRFDFGGCMLRTQPTVLRDGADSVEVLWETQGCVEEDIVKGWSERVGWNPTGMSAAEGTLPIAGALRWRVHRMPRGMRWDGYSSGRPGRVGDSSELKDSGGNSLRGVGRRDVGEKDEIRLEDTTSGWLSEARGIVTHVPVEGDYGGVVILWRARIPLPRAYGVEDDCEDEQVLGIPVEYGQSVPWNGLELLYRVFVVKGSYSMHLKLASVDGSFLPSAPEVGLPSKSSLPPTVVPKGILSASSTRILRPGMPRCTKVCADGSERTSHILQMRVSVLGDSQSGSSTFRTLLDAALHQAPHPPDLILHLGDAVQSPRERQELRLDLWGPLEEGQIGSHVPLARARGNHDGAVGAARVLPWVRAAQTRAYYSFFMGPVHLIVLDSGDVTEQQIEFLKQQLDIPALFQVVIVHIPPFSEYWETKAQWIDRNERGWGDDVRQKIVPILETHKVDLVLSGHSHAYQRGSRNSIPYIVAGGAGGGLDLNHVDIIPDPTRPQKASMFDISVTDVHFGGSLQLWTVTDQKESLTVADRQFLRSELESEFPHLKPPHYTPQPAPCVCVLQWTVHSDQGEPIDNWEKQKPCP